MSNGERKDKSKSRSRSPIAKRSKKRCSSEPRIAGTLLVPDSQFSDEDMPPTQLEATQDGPQSIDAEAEEERAGKKHYNSLTALELAVLCRAQLNNTVKGRNTLATSAYYTIKDIMAELEAKLRSHSPPLPPPPAATKPTEPQNKPLLKTAFKRTTALSTEEADKALVEIALILNKHKHI